MAPAHGRVGASVSARARVIFPDTTNFHPGDRHNGWEVIRIVKSRCALAWSGEGGRAGGNCLIRERRGGVFTIHITRLYRDRNFSSRVSIQTGIGWLCSDNAFAGKVL